MGIFKKNKLPEQKIVSLKDFCQVFDLCEFVSRDLAFEICVNLIANAMTLCKFRTFDGLKEIQGAEYWLWNYEPNTNQNASELIRKLIRRLYLDNEALVFNPRKKNGLDALAVADSFTKEEYVSKPNEYRSVVCGNLTYSKIFKEDDVLHFKLINEDLDRCRKRLIDSYEKLVTASQNKLLWNNGQHWKVHISQIASGVEDFEKKFKTMLEQQMKPFFGEGNTVLPEFDGYSYSQIATEDLTNLSKETRDMVEDIFNQTARSFLIPAVLVNGKLEQTEDANRNFLTYVIDPLSKILEQEINRKRYGYDEYRKGNFLKVDTSTILHFDLFANAANVEKIVGSACYTINNIRESAGQVPINEDWANKHYLTKNIGEVTELGKE